MYLSTLMHHTGGDVVLLRSFCSAGPLQLQPVTLGSSSGLQVGQKTYAIGNPFGLDHTLTQGIISGLGRELNTGTGLTHAATAAVAAAVAMNPDW